MTTFYKLRHKPSGLFFKPTNYPTKLNLSENGKTYNRRPTLRYLGKQINIAENPKYNARQYGSMEYLTEDVIPDRWEIVKYEVVEVESIPCEP